MQVIDIKSGGLQNLRFYYNYLGVLTILSERDVVFDGLGTMGCCPLRSQKSIGWVSERFPTATVVHNQRMHS